MTENNLHRVQELLYDELGQNDRTADFAHFLEHAANLYIERDFALTDCVRKSFVYTGITPSAQLGFVLYANNESLDLSRVSLKATLPKSYLFRVLNQFSGEIVAGYTDDSSRCLYDIVNKHLKNSCSFQICSGIELTLKKIVEGEKEQLRLCRAKFTSPSDSTNKHLLMHYIPEEFAVTLLNHADQLDIAYYRYPNDDASLTLLHERTMFYKIEEGYDFFYSIEHATRAALDDAHRQKFECFFSLVSSQFDKNSFRRLTIRDEPC